MFSIPISIKRLFKVRSLSQLVGSYTRREEKKISRALGSMYLTNLTAAETLLQGLRHGDFADFSGAPNRPFHRAPNRPFHRAPNRPFHREPNRPFQGHPTDRFRGIQETVSQRTQQTVSGAPNRPFYRAPNRPFRGHPTDRFTGNPTDRFTGHPTDRFTGHPTDRLRGTQQTVFMNICSEDLLSTTIFGLKCDEKLEFS